MLRSISLAAGLLLAAASPAPAQIVYGSDSAGALTWQLTSAAGGACLAPNAFTLPCPNAAVVCPSVPAPAPVPPGMLWGDVADDPNTDTIYVTDGRVILAHTGDTPCVSFGTPCVPLDAFFVPTTTPPMGPITGMGCDGSGTFTGGAPLLWITDGRRLAGIVPPLLGSCGSATVLFPPCSLPTALTPVTDVSWDPAAGRLWIVGAAGLVQSLTAPGCTTASPPIAVSACGLLPPLTGLAYDTATPNFTGAGPAAYVTDGATIAYVDLGTGGAAAPSFATPLPCTPTPTPLSGLAHAQHGIRFGTNRIDAHVDSFGQSTSPGASFGIELSGMAPGVPAYLVANLNFPGPGIFCPGLFGVGTIYWVDPTPPSAAVIPLGVQPIGPTCVPIPIALGPGIPPGLEIYIQVVYLLPGWTTATDATEGLTVTIGLP